MVYNMREYLELGRAFRLSAATRLRVVRCAEAACGSYAVLKYGGPAAPSRRWALHPSAASSPYRHRLVNSPRHMSAFGRVVKNAAKRSRAGENAQARLAVTAHKLSATNTYITAKRAEMHTRFAAKHDRSFGVRCVLRAFNFLSHDLTQFAVYVVYIYMFQLMTNYLRDSAEHFNNKYIADVLLEEPFGGTHSLNPEDTFHGVAQVSDIYDWHDNVLWPALLKDELPDGSALLTPTELAAQMDRFDWSAGVSFVQLRAQLVDDSACGAVEYAAVPNMYREAYARAGLKYNSTEAQPRHSNCIPNFAFQMSTLLDSTQQEDKDWKYATVDKEPFGIDVTNGRLIADPFMYYDAEKLGANPGGQRSGSVDINFGSILAGGHPSYVIPFFSNELLPEERGDWTVVKDYRLYAANASATPAYYCVRVSRNGAHIHQACDPNDSAGRTTGVCTRLVREFWREMKAARYIDAQTRALTITLPLRNNNVGVRLRLAMVFQVTSSGAVLPSYDIESRKDVFDADALSRVQLTTLCMCIYFILTEAHELYVLGVGYFANMWNIMDWTNFVLYGMLYQALNRTRDALTEMSCLVICQQVGYVDPWLVLKYNTQAKLYLGILTMVQWIKVIKFINILVPKFSLATSVLSHALADLLLFMIVFMWAIASFAQMFYMQLGPFMRGYSSFFLAVLTLMRSLFGDFDIDAILMASNSYVNVVVFMMYLFFAVFILLSIFLTILGEHQEAIESQKRTIRDEQGHLPHSLEWGVFGEARDFVEMRLSMLREYMIDIQKNHPQIQRACTTMHSARGTFKGTFMLQKGKSMSHKEVGEAIATVERNNRTKSCMSTRTKSPLETLSAAIEDIHRGDSINTPDVADRSSRRRRGNKAVVRRPPAVPIWGFQTHASRLDATAGQLERAVREFEEGFLAQHGRWPEAAEMGEVAASAKRLKELHELKELLRAKAAELLSSSPADRAVGSLDAGRDRGMGGDLLELRVTRHGVGPPPPLPEEEVAADGSAGWQEGRVAIRRSPPRRPSGTPSFLASAADAKEVTTTRRPGRRPSTGRSSFNSVDQDAQGETRRRRRTPGTDKSDETTEQQSEAGLAMASVADQLDGTSCI